MIEIIKKIDNFILNLVEQYHNLKFQKLASYLTHLGDFILHLPIFIIVYFIGSLKIKQFIEVTLLATIIGAITLYIIRFIVKRKRPIGDIPNEFALIPKIENYSFPSGHALRNFIFCITIYPFFGIKYSIVFFIFAIIITLTRIYLKLHYLSDIIFGAILGIISAFISLKIYFNISF